MPEDFSIRQSQFANVQNIDNQKTTKAENGGQPAIHSVGGLPSSPSRTAITNKVNNLLFHVSADGDDDISVSRLNPQKPVTTPTIANKKWSPLPTYDEKMSDDISVSRLAPRHVTAKTTTKQTATKTGASMPRLPTSGQDEDDDVSISRLESHAAPKAATKPQASKTGSSGPRLPTSGQDEDDDISASLLEPKTARLGTKPASTQHAKIDKKSSQDEAFDEMGAMTDKPYKPMYAAKATGGVANKTFHQIGASPTPAKPSAKVHPPTTPPRKHNPPLINNPNNKI